LIDYVYVLLSGEFFERSYFGNLNAIQLNEYYAAAQFDGKIELHLVCAFNVSVILKFAGQVGWGNQCFPDCV
jgi:hypothetical protein